MQLEDARKMVDDLETAAIVQWYAKGDVAEKDKNYNRLQHARNALLKALVFCESD